MWYIHTMEYYSAINRNKIMPFVAMLIELETVVLSEVRKRKTNEPLYRNKLMDLETDLGLPRGERQGMRRAGSLGLVDANYCIWSG